MSDNVPVPTVELLIKELKDVVDDWKVFGVSLGVPVRKLNAIKLNDPNGGVDNWKLDMFQFWLQSRPDDPSWKGVVQALEENNYFNLAATLSRKYLLPTDSNEDEDKSINKDEIKAEIRATAAVVERLRDLESSFTDMLTDLLRLLTKCNCDLSEAQFFLDDQFDTEKFSQCTSFNALLRQLRKGHVDAFNIYYLKRLVANFKKDQLTERIKEYEAEKEKFLKDTTVLEFQCAVVSKVKPLPAGQMVKLTIRISKRLANKRNLKDMEELALLSFRECQRDFVHIHAESGSVIISWFFPEALSGKLEYLAHENAAVFKDAGVEEVTVGGMVVFPCTLEEDIPTASLKEIYTDFYHRLVEAVSDEHTCQSLLTQLSSPALISEEKIAQLISSKVTGSSFLKTLGLEEEPHLLVPLVSAMSGVEQLQTLAETMSAVLRSKQATGARVEQMKLDHDIQTRIDKLKRDFADIVVQALRWLENCYPETKDAVRWLNESLRGLQSDPLVLPSSTVLYDVRLDEQLQKRWSFTNPAILEGLVEKSNDRDLIERMKKYNENFKYVCRSIVISDKEFIIEPFNSDKRCLILILENITDFGDIQLFLREVFDIHRRYLTIHKIEYAVPSKLASPRLH